jgi:hypothetical protein
MKAAAYIVGASILLGAICSFAPSTFAQTAPSPDEHLRNIAPWLASDFQLVTHPLPAVVFDHPEGLLKRRYRGLLPDDWSPQHQPQVIAVYDDEQRTIYLALGWTGATAAETSILVHELVHHAQNLTSLVTSALRLARNLLSRLNSDGFNCTGQILKRNSG